VRWWLGPGARDCCIVRQRGASGPLLLVTDPKDVMVNIPGSRSGQRSGFEREMFGGLREHIFAFVPVSSGGGAEPDDTRHHGPAGWGDSGIAILASGDGNRRSGRLLLIRWTNREGHFLLNSLQMAVKG